MANAIITTNNDTAIDIEMVTNIRNEQLREKTAAIASYGLNARKSALHIAALVAEVRDNKDAWCAEFDGKTSTDKFVAYGEKYLGLKRAQLFAMANVGSKLIADDRRSIIAHDNEIDYTMTQLQKLVSLDVETVKALDESGEINPSMTAKEISDVAFSHDKKAQERKKRNSEKKAKENAAKKTGTTNATTMFELGIYMLEDGSFVCNLNGKDITHNATKDQLRILKYLLNEKQLQHLVEHK